MKDWKGGEGQNTTSLQFLSLLKGFPRPTFRVKVNRPLPYKTAGSCNDPA